MRSKKVLVIVAALVACLAAGSVIATTATAKKKKKKFPATITLAVTKAQAADSYSQGAGNFSGLVSSGGPTKCRSGRTVTVTGPLNGSGTTNADGSYGIPTQTAPPSGTYTATVAKRKIVKKKNGKKKKKVCKAASTSVTFAG